MEVLEDEKLKWEHEPVERVFARYSEFSRTSTSVSITYGNTGKIVFYFFDKITHRNQVKCGNNLYQSLNSPYVLFSMAYPIVYNGVNLSIFKSSNGAGRTGTYIAISNLLERMKLEQTVDVFQSIKIIRSSRPQFVENAVSIFLFR